MAPEKNTTAGPEDATSDNGSIEHQRGNFQSFYLEGWRLQVLTLAMCLGLFLASLESTIVSTSLISISNSLHGFQRSSWIVASYLLSYTGFLLIIAKLSDVFGRKSMMVFCLCLFIAFSIGCGFAQTMTQLIVLRAFQGIGGGGISTLTFVILPENVSPAQYPMYAAIVSATLALSSLLGPIIGGAICDNTTWRWVFLLNGPAGAVALVLLLISLPGNPPSSESLVQKLRKVDYLGTFLVLSSTVLFVTALEQGGTGHSWKSKLVLALLVTSIMLFFVCLTWSWNLHHRGNPQEPMVAWNLLTDRFCLGLFLNSFFMGSVFLSAIIILPQQFQVVFQDSPAKAGYRLLCVTLVSPLFTGIAGYLTQKQKVPPLYILIVAQALAVLGCGLASSLPESSREYPASGYGYQVIMGAGFGLGLSTAIMAAPQAFNKKYMAVGMGTINQMRALGMSIGVSICANILSKTLSSAVADQLLPNQFRAVLGSAEAINSISPELQNQVRHAFAVGFTRQMQAICGLAGAGLLSTLIMIEKKPRFLQA
ncbi:major facilitator superfamily transporter [Amniculicola lignicola CBS 123094]|uniref:Major facilitator superfamily transporter n=1 Tax=Amniculicola lignicola CBS 123094 TaxID=1392246 RepID=A0A6A5WSU5_9PLEO|nr:major facilitator superfamily transporter [Amniculicola lignicola CBS 123094]